VLLAPWLLGPWIIKLALTSMLLLALGQPLAAQDIVVGLGIEEARADQEHAEPLVVLEYWARPFADWSAP
jgi:hypothetical protein